MILMETPLSKIVMPVFHLVESGGYTTLDVAIINRHGLHARPSAKFYERIVKPYGANLDIAFQVSDNPEYLPMISVFDLMSLGLEYGTPIKVRLALKEEARSKISEADLAKQIYELFASEFQEKEKDEKKNS